MTPRDPLLFELFCDAIRTGLEYVRLAETGKTRIGAHLNWPELRWHENGLPWITHRSFDTPKDYSNALNGLYSALYGLGSDEKAPDFKKEPAFIALTEYAKHQPRLRGYLRFDGPHDFGATHLEIMIGYVLDRYIHINKSTELQCDKLMPIYLPIENYLIDVVLPINVIVPILFLKFELATFRINELISIEQMSDEMHLARGWQGSWGTPDNFLVASAATHAIFIQNQSLKNENWSIANGAIINPESYPLDDIDAFFAAIRIATGFATGYAQMLAFPIKWASTYVADLIPVEGPRLESYPPFFKAGYWQQDVPTVSASDAEGIREVFKNLKRAFAMKHAQKVRLAMHRLNLSSMRTTDEDGVIDSMIAMEALLSDGTQEMTHKVAMRLAALYKIVNPTRAERAFKEIKDIYTFRSKIVHGDANLKKHREINREGTRIPAINAAVEHLRTAFDVLMKHPALLDPKEIDRFLLTGNF
jgi:hypothetical protein